jgi:hypothetical protein
MEEIQINPSLFKHLEAIKTNSENMFNAFPQLHLSVESVSDMFDQLFVEQFQQLKGEPWEASVHKMIFGANSSWLQGVIMTSAGFNETGLICVRRGIEYVCYSSKIKASNEKNIIWLDRGLDDEKSKMFSNKFSIPSKYFTEKYLHLKALLVWHDYASTFGAHGNFATLVGKWDSSIKDKVRMSFHDNREGVPISTGVAIRIGAFMIKALYKDFREHLREPKIFEDRINSMSDIINKARIEVLNFDTKGKIKFEDIKAIYGKDEPAIDEMYDKLKSKYIKVI